MQDFHVPSWSMWKILVVRFSYSYPHIQQQQQQLSLLSQASWCRLEMKPTRNKGRRSTKHKNTKAQKKKGRSCLRHIDCKSPSPSIHIMYKKTEDKRKCVGGWVLVCLSISIFSLQYAGELCIVLPEDSWGQTERSPPPTHTHTPRS
jgi:hypothetical protein